MNKVLLDLNSKNLPFDCPIFRYTRYFLEMKLINVILAFKFLTSSLVPWDLFRSFKVCWETKERVGCEKKTRKLPHLSIPSKSAAWVPEFSVKDLPLSRTATLVPIYIYRLYCMAVKLGLSPWVRSTGYGCSRINYLGRYLGLGEM